MNSIGKILQDRRKELGLTQPDVNKELKQFGYSMNHAAISSWERNVTQPNATQFLALCQIRILCHKMPAKKDFGCLVRGGPLKPPYFSRKVLVIV